MSDTKAAQFSLADLAGINVDDVQEFRYTTLPKGAYTFQCEDAKLDEIGGEEVPAAIFEVKVMEVHGLTGLNPGETEEEFVGQTHREVFFLREAKDVGRVKAFVIDAGFALPEKIAFADMLAVFKGHVFPGRIKHRADKNDKSIVYANITLDKSAGQKAA